MAYRIQCLRCGKDTWAENLVDLIESYIDPRGQMTCARCNGTEAYVQQISTRCEKESNQVCAEYIATSADTESPSARILNDL